MSLFRCIAILNEEDNITGKIEKREEDLCFFLADVSRAQSEGKKHTNILFEDGSDVVIKVAFETFYSIFDAYHTPDNEEGIYTTIFSKS